MLKFIAISGTTDVTQNHYVYETEKDMIVVDAGVGFPDPEMLGVDLVIPDFSYVTRNKSKLRGVVITHGHEDHLGALPFLLKDIGNVPVWASKLVAGFIEDKLLDYKVGAKINVFDPEKDSVNLGEFRVTPFRVTHSVPDSCGFCIDTPEGKIFHVPDYKFDWTPVDGKIFDIQKAALLASGGVLALASDCLGATTVGHSESEIEIEKRVQDIVEDVSGAIFFTTISSNISRMQQAINVGMRLGRKVVFVGRSIERKATIAENLGYLKIPSGVVIELKSAKNYDPEKLLYIISGCYGQPGSALYRASMNEHDLVHIDKGDVVIFSADPAPPGSKSNVDFVVDKLFERGVNVHYYDMQEDLHVSGHGSRGDLSTLIGIVKPKYYIPLGGTIRHMKAYSLLAQRMGADESEVFELGDGESVEFQNGNARKGAKIEVKTIMVDGLGIGDVGNVVLRDRQQLSKEGIAIVMIQIDKSKAKTIDTPEIISRGFVYQGKQADFLKDAGLVLEKELIKRKNLNRYTARETTINTLEKYFYRETGRRPMILPLIVEV